MDYWIFVFKAWWSTHEAPLASWSEFQRIMQPIEEHVVETTPGVAFETFPGAVRGYKTRMVRFQLAAEPSPDLLRAWGANAFPWLLLRAAPGRHGIEEAARSRLDTELHAEFLRWLGANLHVLHQPLE